MQMNNKFNKGYQQQSILDNHLILDLGFEKTEEILKMAENFARRRDRKKKLTSNQLRGIYDTAIELRKDPTPKRLIAKLIINLEYAYKRQTIPSDFHWEMTALLNSLLSNPEQKRIGNFVDFFEALVAYSEKGEGGN